MWVSHKTRQENTFEYEVTQKLLVHSIYGWKSQMIFFDKILKQHWYLIFNQCKHQQKVMTLPFHNVIWERIENITIRVDLSTCRSKAPYLKFKIRPRVLKMESFILIVNSLKHQRFVCAVNSKNLIKWDFEMLNACVCVCVCV